MESSTNYWAVALVSLLAVISPGPDFFIVFRNSLVYSRNAGYVTAFGVATALFIHLAYTLIGIGVLLVESPLLYAVVKYVGIGYLIYIGYKGLMSSFQPVKEIVVNTTIEQPSLNASTAFMQGFWTNVLNPKAAMFFISLFSQFIGPDTSWSVALTYATINWVIALIWFLLLSYLLTHHYINKHVDKFRRYIDRVMGIVLILLGIRLIFA